MSEMNVWQYRGSEDWSGLNIAGYKVAATDGDIGKVDEASAEVGSTANTRPAASAASITRLVTTPAPQ